MLEFVELMYELIWPFPGPHLYHDVPYHFGKFAFCRHDGSDGLFRRPSLPSGFWIVDTSGVDPRPFKYVGSLAAKQYHISFAVQVS